MEAMVGHPHFNHENKQMLVYTSSVPSNIVDKYFNIIGQKSNILISYALLGSDTGKILRTHRNKIDSLILDSGAWTDQKSTVKTDIDEYIDYLRICGTHYDFYFNLDPDFSDVTFSSINKSNLLKMEAAGLNPVPVIHSLYSEEIDYYIDKRYPIVALGSSKATRLDELQFVFDKFESYPHVKIHVFGTTRYENLIEVPAYSVDSSTWAQIAKHGCIVWWNLELEGVDKTDYVYIGGRVRTKTISTATPHFITYKFKMKLEQYLYDTFKLTFRDLLGLDGIYNMQVVNMYHYNELAKRITEEHLKKGFMP